MSDYYQKAHDAYQATVARLEPDITPLDTSGALASIAISLKRIADSQDEFNTLLRSMITQGYLDVRVTS